MSTIKKISPPWLGYYQNHDCAINDCLDSFFYLGLCWATEPSNYKKEFPKIFLFNILYQREIIF